jgi:hypothetical protein
MPVQLGGVELHPLPGAARHDRLALVVDIQHQPLRLLAAVAEQLLEHPGHV